MLVPLCLFHMKNLSPRALSVSVLDMCFLYLLKSCHTETFIQYFQKSIKRSCVTMTLHLPGYIWQIIFRGEADKWESFWTIKYIYSNHHIIFLCILSTGSLFQVVSSFYARTKLIIFTGCHSDSFHFRWTPVFIC